MTTTRETPEEGVVATTLAASLSRRSVLRRAGVIGLGIVATPALLAACGGDDDDDDSPAATATTASGGGAATAAPENTAAAGAEATEPAASADATEPAAAATEPAGGTDTGTGSGEGLPDFDAPDRASLPSPQRLTYAGSRDPDTLDVNVSVFGHVHRILSMVYEPLVYEDRSNSFQPGLATAWEIAEDGLTYTFTVREGVKFHDDTDFNAEAVKFAFDRIIDPATQSKRAINLIGPYTGSEVIDETTVAISLEEPFAGFLDGISYNFCGIPSPTAVKAMGDDFGRKPVATGPMMVTEWIAQDSVTMKKFEGYNWASPLFNLDGEAYLDEFIYKVVPEEATRAAVLETGEVDMIDTLPNKDFQRFTDNGDLTVLKEDTPGVPVIYMLNSEKAPLDDVNVRQALIYALDRQEIVDIIDYGVPKVAYGPIASGTFAYNTELEALYPYDQDKAKSLLEEAGWVEGGDGIREKDGKKLELELLTITSNSRHEFIQAVLADVGVKVNIQTGTDAWWQESGIRGDHHMLSESISGSDPYVLRWHFHSENIGTGFSRTRFRDARLDELLENGHTETDPAMRREIYGEVQQIIMDNALIIPIEEGTFSLAFKKNIKNVALDARVYYTWLHSTYFANE